jgi:hypothetical protein
MPSEPADPSVILRARRLVAFAAIAVAIALRFSNGHLDPFSLTAMTLAVAAGLGAALRCRCLYGLGRPSRLESLIARDPAKLLWFGLAVSVAINLVLLPGYYVDRARLGLFRPLMVAAGLLVWSYRWRRQPRLLVRARFPLFLVLAATMSAVVFWASPRPAIDVWSFEQLGTEALARGQNPYALEYPNIYGSGTHMYAKSVLAADRAHIPSYPYMPLTLFLFLPSVILAHEVRWVLAACVLFAAWAIRRLGRGALAAELAAVFLLVQPRAFFVLEQSWTEPMILAALALTLLAATSWSDREAAGNAGAGAWIATGLAGGLLAATKQYTPIILVPVFFALPVRGRWKAAALAVAGAAALMLPFLLLDWRAFFTGVLAHHFRQPFRMDSLSWPAAIAWLGGPRLLSSWPAFAAAAAALAATLECRLPLARAPTAAAVALMALQLLNPKQAFCNYYWLAGGLFCVATALYAGRLPLAEVESVLPDRAEGATAHLSRTSQAR